MTTAALPIVSVDSDFEVDDSNSDVDTDEFEVIDKESVYDTAVEDLVPAVGRLHINTTTTPVAPRIARENSDDTLVDPGSESELRHPRACAPPSPVSPSSDGTPRPQTRGQRRMAASPELVNVTTTRPRTRAHTRVLDAPRVRSPAPELPRTRARASAVSPTPAPKSRTREVHTHAFLIQPNSARRARVYACGALWNERVNALA
ncbi:hypothetical protein B0H13DRAFT_288122 [Mycena leptocephala]|nr:hypothetical protein B0H13DRAFT_288122 [Mycena leptocephala]